MEQKNTHAWRVVAGRCESPRCVQVAVTGVFVLVEVVWLLGLNQWSITPRLAMLIPALLVTGTFFPLIFEQVPNGRLQLFSMDAVGATVGAILAFFVPMVMVSRYSRPLRFSCS